MSHKILVDTSGKTVGSKYYVIAGDGNCMFSSISLAVFNDVTLQSSVRRDAVAYIEANWEAVKILFGLDEDKQSYVSVMKRDKVWGSSTELYALSEFYGRRIIVVENDVVKFDLGDRTDNSPIFLRLAFNHYSLYQGRPVNIVLDDESVTSSDNDDYDSDHDSNDERIDQDGDSNDKDDECSVDSPDDLDSDEEVDSPDGQQSDEDVAGDGADRPPLLDKNPIRPSNWRIPPALVDAPVRISFKPGRSTYSRFGIIYGPEDLSTIETQSLGHCEFKCAHCQATFWGSQLSINKKTSAICCCNGTVSLPLGGEFEQPSDQILSLFDGRHPLSKHFLNFIIPYNKIFETVYPQGRFEYMGRDRTKGSSLRVNGEVKFVAEPHKTCIRRKQVDGTIQYLPGTINQGHVFFLELTVDAVRHRITNSSVSEKLDEQIVVMLERYLRRENKFIQWFKYTNEVYEAEKAAAQQENREMKEVVLVINPTPLETDLRRIGTATYRNRIFDRGFTAQPLNDFVAAVFTGEVPEYTYDLKVFPRESFNGERSVYPPHFSRRTLNTMMYPLVYLHGEFGWAVKRSTRGRGRVDEPNGSDSDVDGDLGTVVVCRGQDDDDWASYKTATITEYARYRLGRRDKVPILMRAERLFLHWLINTQLRVEYDRLEYYRLHQEELRLDTYKSLYSFMVSQAEAQNRGVGRMVIVPPDFEGTSKHKRETFLDFLAIVERKGPPSFFVTFTCNAKWPEIIERCQKEGCKPEFRPDIVNDVFYEKWKSFLSDVVFHQMYGRCAAYNVVFEAQNRQLMHAHAMFIMEPADQPLTAEEVDRIVWAEIPDPEKNKELFQVVKQFNIHGPCNVKKSASFGWPCRKKDGNCRFDYPKPFRNTTCISARKPGYKRLPGGPTFTKYINNTKVVIDNRWVVPYNPVASLRYWCHICFEYCPNCMCVRYMAKYFTKAGHTEKVLITEKNRHNPQDISFEYDEVQAYKEMRALGAYEAHFRIMGHSLTAMSVPVEKLCVHTEDNQNLKFSAERNAWVEALDRNPETQLTAWFKLNEQEPQNRDKFYKNVVENYSWKGTDRKWVGPKNRRTIGRLCTVELTTHTVETWYLRLLLVNRTGCLSFADVRTVRGKTYRTYQEACVALGLVHDDVYVLHALEEIEHIASGRQLRRFFCGILTHCTPKDALALWYQFADSLSQDYFFRSQDRPESMRQALFDMQSILDANGTTLAFYNLPCGESFVFEESKYLPRVLDRPPADLHLANFISDDSDDSVRRDEDELAGQIMKTQLNTEQNTVFETVIKAIRGDTKEKLFFLSAAGGTGKTMTLQFIAAFCHVNKINCISVAYTGIASTLLFKGKTSHRTFGIPLTKSEHETTTSSIKMQSKEAQLLSEVELIIWDEVSMVSSWQLEVVDLLMQTCKDNSKEPFGGCIVILSGDLRQLLPVMKNVSTAEVLDNTIIASRLWAYFGHLSLTTNMRTGAEESSFASWLLDVAEGRLNVNNGLEINLPGDMIVESVETLIKFVFPDFRGLHDKFSAVLTPTNLGADMINDMVLKKFKKNEEEKVYLPATSLVNRDKNSKADISQEYLESLSSGSLPQHRLKLKVGVPVLLMRNINIPLGLCNGTRMIVLHLFDHSVLCQITHGMHRGKKHFIPRIIFQVNEFGLPGSLRRVQFPLKLAFAMTINRAQGQTINGKLGIYLERPPFSHEMLYVALSRVTRKSDVRICVEEGEFQGKRNKGIGGCFKKRKEYYTQNPIYFEILKHIPEFNQRSL